MKKIIGIAFCTLFMVACQNDDDQTAENVPAVVANTFQTQFTNVTDIEWEKTGADYEVEFEISNIDHKALINAEGMLVKHKYDVLLTELPQAIQTRIQEDYPNAQIDDSEVLEIDDAIYYQVEIDQNIIDLQKVYEANGEENSTVSYWD